MRDPINLWFAAAEYLGEYIGIRFGHLPPGSQRPEWIFLRHTQFDGIGGLAELLRQRGTDVARLLQIKHASPPSVMALLRALPKYLGPRRRHQWLPLPGEPRPSNNRQPPPAVAWHVFDANSTTQIRRVCRKASVTVNSFLLKHLTKAVRPSLRDQSALIPWMIPVNLRGKVARDNDLANHSSYVSVKVGAYDTVYDVHRNVYTALASGEHWANWFAYKGGLILPAWMRRFAVRTGRAVSQWNVGGFSNLGDWDPEKKITNAEAAGAWLFSPPVLRCQMIGAGCVTFQNRLSLVIQVHPELTTDSTVPAEWLANWIKEVEIDLVSVLAEPASVHRSLPLLD
jgi:NRPS condensation-like uncharacterized protein